MMKMVHMLKNWSRAGFCPNPRGWRHKAAKPLGSTSSKPLGSTSCAIFSSMMMIDQGGNRNIDDFEINFKMICKVVETKSQHFSSITSHVRKTVLAVERLWIEMVTTLDHDDDDGNEKKDLMIMMMIRSDQMMMLMPITMTMTMTMTMTFMMTTTMTILMCF